MCWVGLALQLHFHTSLLAVYHNTFTQLSTAFTAKHYYCLHIIIVKVVDQPKMKILSKPLKNARIQTTLVAIDFHFQNISFWVPQKVIQVWNDKGE